MVEAYNHMIASYIPRTNEQYQVHKKNELRNVYKRIINISKKSPFYKIDLSEENQKYTINLKENALQLYTSLSSLTAPDSDVFTPTEIYISDEEVVEAEYMKKPDGSLPSSFSLNIKQLAKQQINAGTSLYYRDQGLDAGGYRLNLLTNHGNYQMNLFFDVKTSNLEQQQQIVNEIKAKDYGIRAKIVEDKYEGYYHIELTGEDTVKLNCAPFLFTDQFDNEEGPVEYFGLNQCIEDPREAIFSLNDSITIARQNQFVMGDTLRIKLMKESREPIDIRLVPKDETILSALDNFVQVYNRLIDTALSRTSQSDEHNGAAKLLWSCKSITASYAEEMENCGISIVGDGKLELDQKKAVRALHEGILEQELHKNTGFFETLKIKSSNVSINPVDYLDKTVITYPDVKKTAYPNPYSTSMYSGMFFNYYC